MACYTIIYGFMAKDLKLRGYSKDVYAVIFGFWIKKKQPVCIPYATFKIIVGAAAPAVSNSLKLLVSRGLITADPKPGTMTRYEIVMTDALMKAYHRDSGYVASSKSEELRSSKSSSNDSSGSSTAAEANNKDKNKKEKGRSPKMSEMSLPSRTCYTQDSRMSLKKK